MKNLVEIANPLQKRYVFNRECVQMHENMIPALIEKAPLTQRLECGSYESKVVGSNPTGSTFFMPLL